jgi:GT2 family glycosyltransferase
LDGTGTVFDLVTVFHNDRNLAQSKQLEFDLQLYADEEYKLWKVDNQVENRGFAKACNLGAAWGHHPYIGFLNPDVIVEGPILGEIARVFRECPKVVITGERFGKLNSELRVWGVRDWVCGASLFVRRAWWENHGGFDEQFVWGWEETDLIRRAEARGDQVVSISLPISHESPHEETPEDFAYKRKWFKEGADRFYRKWR